MSNDRLLGDLIYSIDSNITSNTTVFSTSGLERMRITETGNVGIGTSSPVGSLDVAGDLRISGPIDITTYVETDTSPVISGGTLTLDLSAATIFDVALNAAITTLNINNVVPTAGKSVGFVIIFTADGTPRSVAWPVSFRWPDAVAPTITSTNGKRDIFTFFSTDNGTSWNAFISGQNI